MMDLQSLTLNEQSVELSDEQTHQTHAFNLNDNGSKNSNSRSFFFEVKGFNPLITQSLKNKLIDLGLYPGVRFQTINKIKLSKVIVIRFDQTLVALSQVEFDQLIL